MKRNLRSLLAVAIAASLAACNSADNAVDVAGVNSNAYLCDTTMMTQSDDLRIYQIMVESFVNGDSSIGHGTGYGTSHHKGDLQGIIDSLDYIESLGMNAIWLTPIFDSIPVDGQDHWADRLDATGYFTSNYFAVDPRFGTMDQARELVEKAHEKGLYVFFDGVFGHHKGNVVPSPQGRLPAGENNPVSYPESLEFYQEVATYWIEELKIDGWRLDQAYQVPTEAWAAIRASVDQASKSVSYVNSEGETVNPLGYMVAEIWNNENYIKETGYGMEGNPALCSAFDFPVRYRVVETFAVNENSIGNKGGKWLDEGMSLHSLYPSHAKPNLMLGNHDMVRFGDLLQRGNIASPEQPEYWNRHKAALSFQAAYSGPITLYYGEEIGDELDGYANKVEQDCAVRGLCDDHVARTSANIEGITATLDANQRDLKQYVSQLMALRADHPALSRGERSNIVANETVYVDHKQADDDTLLYMVSTTAQSDTVVLKASEIASEGQLVDLLTGKIYSAVDGKYSIKLEPFEAKFLSIEKPSAAGLMKAAAATSASLMGEGFMAQCDNPAVGSAGPVGKTLYVVGDFVDAGWKHKPNRAYSYVGNNTYQAVVDEKAGAFRMQYASKDWSPQFTADGLELSPGKIATLKRGGYGKDTAVTLPEAGKYVWSLSFSDSGEPEQLMVSKCP
ncbi:alpha-amylase family glycosyl hydrolase (plasmid) [Photobacterium sp. DA100]|uniref:alpha-amylase family glycosyl hydrolase n=1 Tax=Photobacterium sp. DA100 TaxID=3027472 RepID=UPI00247B205B|nr:alpha-amylase family glycosyl hydrolase [Photobacterium sp. DA100]WEM45656.1 alpha-amylase family glycosyl hydrolase [Photobacterium sp. DA100]